MKRRTLSFALVAVLMLALVLVPMFAMTAAAAEESGSISFASTAQRVSQTTSKQVWQNGVITFTNNKASSTTNVANYSNPVRLYAKSNVVIECSAGNITSIEFTATSSSYANVFTKSTVDNGTITVSSTKVTWTLSTPAPTATITSLNAQTRISSLIVNYVAVAPDCQHTNTTSTTVQPGKTTPGSITVTCDDCNAVIGEPEVIPPLGCNVTFDVPDGATAPDSLESVLTATMPDAVEAPDSFNAQNYVFAGWAETSVADTTDKPTLYQPGDVVTLKDDTTFYAVYSYGVQGATVTQFSKVTEELTDYTGTFIIVYESGSNAYVFNGQDAANGYVSATITNSTIEDSADLEACYVTIAKMTNGYSLYVNDNYIGGKSGSNTISTSTSALLNTISVDENGVATITSNTSSIQFNATSGQMRFRYYKSGSSQKSVCLYQLTEFTGEATTYTTELQSTDCQHTNVNTETVDATCTTPGSTVVTCLDCGIVIDSSDTPATGHS